MADTRSWCADLAAARHEPLHATASRVRSWLLLEQPGAWGADALVQSALDPDVAQALESASLELGLRVLLVRRPDLSSGDTRRCFLAHSRGSNRWIEQRELADPVEILGADLEALAEGRPPGFGAPRVEPLYLVCTNTRHDPCCGRLGRPVAKALGRADEEAVWECSHVGGERFAANLVCLPHGLYFGRLDPDSALRVVASFRRGLIELDEYRGRAGDPFPVQAAEFFVRRRHGLRGVDDLVRTSARRVSENVVDVAFAGPGGSRFEVRVGSTPAPDARPLTCAASLPGRPQTYALLELRAL